MVNTVHALAPTWEAGYLRPELKADLKHKSLNCSFYLIPKYLMLIKLSIKELQCDKLYAHLIKKNLWNRAGSERLLTTYSIWLILDDSSITGEFAVYTAKPAQSTGFYLHDSRSHYLMNELLCRSVKSHLIECTFQPWHLCSRYQSCRQLGKSKENMKEGAVIIRLCFRQQAWEQMLAETCI